MRQDIGVCPIEYSDKLGRDFFSSSKANQEVLGQYFTPFEVADFMASMLEPINKPTVRLLDPGAGSGVLAAAAVKTLAERSPDAISHFFVDLYEVDPALVGKLESAMGHLSEWCHKRRKKLTYNIMDEDFVLSSSSSLGNQPSLLQKPNEYDVVISNPPYFKISKDDPRAVACESIVYGQPNIYALFMAISAALLSAEGQLVFITPRSFASGQYFKAFRNYFFSKVALRRIHQFVSRVDAFDRDSVLQENIIIYGKHGKHDARSKIIISCSQGRSDLAKSSSLVVSEGKILDKKNDFTLSLPSNKRDLAILDLVRTWTNSLERMDLKISTGPVVPFRATEFLSSEKEKTTVPLYWIQHVKPMQTQFPLKEFRKQQWIKRSKNSEKLLVKNQNMILMRRFSPKEDFRRMTVAPFLKEAYDGSVVGLENHLNYIYRPNGEFSAVEVFGLAAFLSSGIFDAYFRILNGNTQVSATELRSAPLPSKTELAEIGTLVLKTSANSHQALDAIVDDVIEIKDSP